MLRKAHAQVAQENGMQPDIAAVAGKNGTTTTEQRDGLVSRDSPATASGQSSG